ncbi:zinc finger protein 521 isoform X1 [Folsomia candida]|uniref:zinc finger protein 521 isoform X1 n=1 Tax=Folsomia candida TaxID=158441 RepID=UPI001604BC04|nr:zinc finger protein 521 isoform X1 [Folsomia candida]XP_035713009.1 zinc finger protein 521 isoform X1 [Folsomia candida]
MTKKGTGHILQDLLSSTVLLHRSNFVTTNFPPKIEEDHSSPELTPSFCSICTESGTNLRPLTLQLTEILAKFEILNQEQISLISQTDHHPAIFCCKICSSAILSLAKLTTQIANITISLRAIISSRNGLFNKGRKEDAKITELCHEIAANNGNNDQQLSGCVEEEEEFSVKVEPICDEDDVDDDNLDEITPHPSSESDDDSDLANSDVGVELICKICHPNATFYDNAGYERHLKNKNIHPDISEDDIAHLQQPDSVKRKFACKLCKCKFAKKVNLLRHLASRKLRPDLSEVDLAAATAAVKTTERKRSVPPKRKEFPCPKCDKTFASKVGLQKHNRVSHEWAPFRRKCTLCPKSFTKSTLLQRHMFARHNVPIPMLTRVRRETLHSCAICAKIMALAGMQRHVETVHFLDKTSCPYGCQVKIDSEAAWVSHLEGCGSPKMSVESESICKYCPAVFRNTLLRIEHHLRVHPQNTYPCSTCQQRFTLQSVLSSHSCFKILEKNVLNSGPDVNSGSKYVSQPNISNRHMRNKIIRPDISEFSNAVAHYPADQIYNNEHALQLTGFTDEEEEKFFVKGDPICEIMSDPLKMSESENDDVANSRVHVEPKYVCKICQPNVTFTRNHNYKCHMTNKNIHPDVSEADIAQLSNQVAPPPADQIYNEDDAQHFAEEEEKFSVEISEITSDPLKMSESEDDEVANSGVHVEPKYVCKICQPNVTFTRHHNYKCHMTNKKIHPDVSEADIVRFHPNLDLKKSACQLCHKKFAKHAHLLRHLSSRKIHRDISDADFAAAFERTERQQRPIPCPKCDQIFTSYLEFRRHFFLSSHEWVTYHRKCTLCPKAFAKLTLLQRHMFTHHNVPIPQNAWLEPRHSCAICAKTFASPATQQRHVEGVHLPDKTSCPYGCETKIDSEAAWLTHLEGCDSPKMRAESECACKYCPAVFRNILLQMQHLLRVHPENTCPCPSCGQRFTRKTALQDHHCPRNGHVPKSGLPDARYLPALHVSGAPPVRTPLQPTRFPFPTTTPTNSQKKNFP